MKPVRFIYIILILIILLNSCMSLNEIDKSSERKEEVVSLNKEIIIEEPQKNIILKHISNKTEYPITLKYLSIDQQNNFLKKRIIIKPQETKKISLGYIEDKEIEISFAYQNNDKQIPPFFIGSYHNFIDNKSLTVFNDFLTKTGYETILSFNLIKNFNYDVYIYNLIAIEQEVIEEYNPIENVKITINKDKIEDSDPFIIKIPNSSEKIILKKINSGSFLMGSSPNESGRKSNEQQHLVNITNPYLIGIYEVTQEQWVAVMKNNPAYRKEENFPVEKVSWYDVIEYCNKLSILVGKEPVYSIKGTTITWDKTKNGFRLPTEAEWEYAARGGNNNSNEIYSGSNQLSEVGWYRNTIFLCKSHEVGQKKPNILGIYDMSGNVWEWCWDIYNKNYYLESNGFNDPTGAEKGSHRIVRGGCWNILKNNCRVAARFFHNPSFRFNNLGFRLVCST